MLVHSSARRLALALVLARGLSGELANAEVASVLSDADRRDLSYEKAHALFLEGRRLLAGGETLEACEQFEQSLLLENAVGTKFNLAACWEKLGKTATAQGLYAEVAEITRELGQTERAKLARERVAALEPRLSRLVIDVESPTPGLTIERNRSPVARESWGSPLAVDPDTYEIRASAPGKQTWSRNIRVSARRALVVVSVPHLVDEPSRPAEVPAEPPPAEPEPVEIASPRQEEVVPAWRRPVAFGLATLGLGGIAAGTVFALKYRSSNDAAEGICTARPSCSREEIDQHERFAREARAARNGAYISLGVGAAAFASAAIAYFGYRTESGVEVRAEPALDTGSFGLSAHGRF